jgi:hypothetical protein
MSRQARVVVHPEERIVYKLLIPHKIYGIEGITPTVGVSLAPSYPALPWTLLSGRLSY